MSFEFLFSLVALFGLAALGAPLAYSMIVGSIAFLLMTGQDLGLVAEQMMQGMLHSFVILAIPLFILSAKIMNEGAISDRLLEFCMALVGRFRGGLAHVNVISSLIFSGMSGSAIADVAGIGRVLISMMTKNNRYSQGYAAAITAASATIGPIFPPSIPMVMYALVSDASIGYLFLGGIIPGLLMAGALMLMIFYQVAIRSKSPEKIRDEAIPLRELPRLTSRAFPALMLPVILMFGIYGGVTTPTEAAAVAALYAFLVATVLYKAISPKKLYGIIFDSAHSSAIVGLIIAAAYIFNYVVASANVPQFIALMIKDINVEPWVFLLIANLIFLLVGSLLDATTNILVIVPLFIPACQALGIDLVHFGVVIILNIMIGLCTPPYGILLYVICATTGISYGSIVKEIWPFLIALLIVLVILTLSPDLALFVPRIFGYKG